MSERPGPADDGERELTDDEFIALLDRELRRQLPLLDELTALTPKPYGR